MLVSEIAASLISHKIPNEKNMGNLVVMFDLSGADPKQSIETQHRVCVVIAQDY